MDENIINRSGLRTEDEIIDSWAIKDLTVSIVCIVFNQERYIEETIRSFLLQRTTFAIEIIIHDDVSSDASVAIIEKYKSLYPRLIKPIIASENQFSQYMCKPIVNCLKVAKSPYIALCEGDDYWVDIDKLEKQYQACAKYPKASLCFTAAKEIDEVTRKEQVICQPYSVRKIISSEDAIVNRGGYMPTASLFIKSSYTPFIIENAKSWPIGDFFIQSYLAIVGEVVFLPEITCVYRRNTENSWTDSQKAKEQRYKYSVKMVKALPSFHNKLKGYKGSEFLVQPFAYYVKGGLAASSSPSQVIELLQLLVTKSFVFVLASLPKLVYKKLLNLFK